MRAQIRRTQSTDTRAREERARHPDAAQAVEDAFGRLAVARSQVCVSACVCASVSALVRVCVCVCVRLCVR